jgi:uncharacterized membrane protein
MKRTTTIGLALAAVLALSAAIGVASGAIPASDGMITACYSKANGDLRVVDSEAGQTCKASENELSWKQGTSAPTVRAATVFLNPGATASARAACPEGQKATRGRLHLRDSRSDRRRGGQGQPAADACRRASRLDRHVHQQLNPGRARQRHRDLHFVGAESDTDGRQRRAEVAPFDDHCMLDQERGLLAAQPNDRFWSWLGRRRLIQPVQW